jgi:pilus assembly protein Flp/PilA
MNLLRWIIILTAMTETKGRSFPRRAALLFCDQILQTLINSAQIKPMKTIRRFIADESGATAIEYALIATGIAIAIIAAVNGVGSKLKTNLGTISTSLK